MPEQPPIADVPVAAGPGLVEALDGEAGERTALHDVVTSSSTTIVAPVASRDGLQPMSLVHRARANSSRPVDAQPRLI
ncbi:MAG: hypothetical protein E6J41_26595 [Chloroflexi bacterium]|nr:MAG: hypothetical protein E6J41_26595 [Chloroflexota bacterium]